MNKTTSTAFDVVTPSKRSRPRKGRPTSEAVETPTANTASFTRPQTTPVVFKRDTLIINGRLVPEIKAGDWKPLAQIPRSEIRPASEMALLDYRRRMRVGFDYDEPVTAGATNATRSRDEQGKLF